MAIAERLALAALLAVTVSACGQSGEEQTPETAPAAVEPAPESAAPDAAAAPETAPAVEIAEHEPPGNRPPETLWRLYCVECHAPGAGHPGTMMLAEKKGEAQSAILGREDLTAEYITVTVRGGLLEMAPFRPTEITDEELAALAEYIRTTAPDAAPADTGAQAGG